MAERDFQRIEGIKATLAWSEHMPQVKVMAPLLNAFWIFMPIAVPASEPPGASWAAGLAYPRGVTQAEFTSGRRFSPRSPHQPHGTPV